MWPKMRVTTHILYSNSAKFHFTITEVEGRKVLQQMKKKCIFSYGEKFHNKTLTQDAQTFIVK